MVVDTSALIVILRDERNADAFLRALHASPINRLSTGRWIEFAAVDARRFGGVLRDDAERLQDEARIVIEPVTLEQARIGQDAYRRYGLGTGHRARLNCGDCFAYALAKAAGEPLLYVGDDFVHTDIVAAL